MRKRARDKNKLVAAWVIAPNVFLLFAALRLTPHNQSKSRPAAPPERSRSGAAPPERSFEHQAETLLSKAVVATDWPLELVNSINRFSRLHLHSTSSSAPRRAHPPQNTRTTPTNQAGGKIRDGATGCTGKKRENADFWDEQRRKSQMELKTWQSIHNFFSINY